MMNTVLYYTTELPNVVIMISDGLRRLPDGVGRDAAFLKIHQRGVQWKRGVVIYMMLHTSSLHHAAHIHCTPFPLHPLVMNMPSPPTRSLDFREFDSSKLLILKGGNSHVRIIL